jgi:hypothetical protein
MKLLINKAEAETDKVLRNYQKKIKEKENEWMKLLEETRSAVISAKESQEKFAAIKK